MNESHDEEAGNKHKHEISPHRSMYKCRISQILQLRLKRKKKSIAALSLLDFAMLNETPDQAE